jgi:hypothetical protein
MEMNDDRKPYPTAVSDEHWAFIASSGTLMHHDAPQGRHNVREVLCR